MGQTTIRIPDELLEKIDEATEPEESRSEWIREACREELSDVQDGEDIEEEVEKVREAVIRLQDRVDDLEREQGGVFGGLFG